MVSRPIRELGWIVGAAAAIAVAWWRVDAAWVTVPDGTRAYMASVAEAIDAVPYKIGPWLGRDVEVSPAAVEMLQPNRVLQRVYRTPRGDSSFTLLISHCGVTRDMLGHYPPVCYPAHGWTQGAIEPVSFSAGEWRIPARRYEFTRGLGLEAKRMMVTNFFVLPSESRRFEVSMDNLNTLDVLTSRHSEGIAQVQVLVDAETPPETVDAITDAVLEVIAPVIDQISTRRDWSDA